MPRVTLLTVKWKCCFAHMVSILNEEITSYVLNLQLNLMQVKYRTGNLVCVWFVVLLNVRYWVKIVE